MKICIPIKYRWVSPAILSRNIKEAKLFIEINDKCLFVINLTYAIADVEELRNIVKTIDADEKKITMNITRPRLMENQEEVIIKMIDKILHINTRRMEIYISEEYMKQIF